MKSVSRKITCDKCKTAVPLGVFRLKPFGWKKVYLGFGVLKSRKFDICPKCMDKTKAMQDLRKLKHVALMQWFMEQPGIFTKSLALKWFQASVLLARRAIKNVAKARDRLPSIKGAALPKKPS